VQRKEEEKQLKQEVNNALAKGNPGKEDRDPRDDPLTSVTDLLQGPSQRIQR
jgi:hypothetical protein